MKILGKTWQDPKDQKWLIEVPILDLVTQAETQKTVEEMLKDAIECLVDQKDFVVTVRVKDQDLLIEASVPKLLTALILKRQRMRNHLTLQEVANNLGAKSINDYAQYEQGRHLPSMEKFEQLLQAIDSKRTPVIAYS